MNTWELIVIQLQVIGVLLSVSFTSESKNCRSLQNLSTRFLINS